jgi:hypothetical protein
VLSESDIICISKTDVIDKLSKTKKIQQTFHNIQATFLLSLQGHPKKPQGVFIILGSVRKSFDVKDLVHR